MVVSRELAIIGSGGHALSFASVAEAAGYTVICFIDSNDDRKESFGTPILNNLEEVSNVNRLQFGLAIGDNFNGENLFLESLKRFDLSRFPAVIHPSAVVCNFATIGFGTVVMPNSVIGANSRVGKFCILNTNTVIEHDSVIEDFVSIAPSATLAGNVTIGFRSVISMGSLVRQKISVGKDSVLGANSFLNTDLEDNVLAYGNPAKIIRKRVLGEPYLD